MAPTLRSITFAQNSYTNSVDISPIVFITNLTDDAVESFNLGRFTSKVAMTNPLVGWNPEFGWTDYTPQQSCREIVIDRANGSPIPADKLLRIGLSRPSGFQTVGVSCSCTEDTPGACATTRYSRSSKRTAG